MHLIPIILMLALGACSGSQDEPTTPPPSDRGDSSTDLPPSGPALEGEIPTVPRDVLDRALGRSVGDFLNRHVEVEPCHEGDGFEGWRIVRFVSEPAPWLDLRVNDVVLAVNRLPLEHPEDAQQVWETLRISSEVLIDLKRNGEPRSIRIPIGDGQTPPPSEPPPTTEETPADD